MIQSMRRGQLLIYPYTYMELIRANTEIQCSNEGYKTEFIVVNTKQLAHFNRHQMIQVDF